MTEAPETPKPPVSDKTAAAVAKNKNVPDAPPGAPLEGPDPTRFGDWEKKGRCIDF